LEYEPLKDFAYHAPKTLAAATALLAEHNGTARILAGGTDILVQLREGLREADVVVDVKHIPELMQLDYGAATGLRLGASVPCYRIYDDAKVSAAYPALSDSARIIGGWQIQSRASIGGNLCNSSPAADSTPSLIVLNAKAQIVGPAGNREVPIQDFCTAPGRNVLKPGEMVVSIAFPAPAPRSGSAYERFIPRNEMDIAVVGAASWLQLSAPGDKIEAARIAVGAVAPTPKFAEAASQSLLGQAPSEAAFAKAGELARQVASPITDMRGTAEYRMHLVGILVKRTLTKAVERARSGK
jgi:carbon-monoxide dehydrogenase medium subunit